ncbi:MAG: tyrosine-type recombinase/integrase [Sporolactobacillus sp.]
MASIKHYQTKKGRRWYFKIELGTDPKTGKRRNTTRRGFLNKPAAERALDRFKEQQKKGLPTNENILVKDLAKKWLKFYRDSNKCKDQTVILREKQMKRFIKEFGYAKAKNVFHLDYQQFINDLKNKYSLKKNTVSGIHTTIHMIFNFGIREKFIKKDPTEDIEMPAYPMEVEEIEKIEESYFEKKEMEEFLEIAMHYKKTDMYAFFFTLLWTGMRIGELIGLEWGDINFGQDQIKIRRTYVNTTKNTDSPKTKSSIRSFGMELELANVLKKQHAHLEELGFIHPALKNTSIVFPQLSGKSIGKRYTEKKIEYAMDKIQSQLSFNKRLTPHKLRHTFASIAAEAEIPLEDIQAILGHQDDEITRKIYRHITQTRQKQISHKFGEWMRQKG